MWCHGRKLDDLSIPPELVISTANCDKTLAFVLYLYQWGLVDCFTHYSGIYKIRGRIRPFETEHFLITLQKVVYLVSQTRTSVDKRQNKNDRKMEK